MSREISEETVKKIHKILIGIISFHKIFPYFASLESLSKRAKEILVELGPAHK